MRCPHCPDSTLLMTDRQGIEIDYCPTCRGVWLDRGELDKLVERAASQAASAPAPSAAPQQPQQPYPQQPYPQQPQYHGKHHYKKPKSWLSDIFD